MPKWGGPLDRGDADGDPSAEGDLRMTRTATTQSRMTMSVIVTAPKHCNLPTMSRSQLWYWARVIGRWTGLVFFGLLSLRSAVFSVRTVARGEYALFPLGLILLALNGGTFYALTSKVRKKTSPKIVD